MKSKYICQWCGKKNIEGNFIQGLYDEKHPENDLELRFCSILHHTLWRQKHIPNMLHKNEKEYLARVGKTNIKNDRK